MTTYYGENAAQALGVQLVAGRLLQPDDYMDFDDVVKAAQAGDNKRLPQRAGDHPATGRAPVARAERAGQA